MPLPVKFAPMSARLSGRPVSAMGNRNTLPATAIMRPTLPVLLEMVRNQLPRDAMMPTMKKLKYYGKYAKVGKPSTYLPIGTATRTR